MARKERSAGVVVFQNTDDGRRYLLLNYGKHWDYPKGHVERDETLEQAAIRELQEETGITGVSFIPDFAQQIRYFFRSTKGLIDKTVVFYLGAIDSDKVTLSEEHVGYEFLPFEQAMHRLTYSSAKEILRKAEEFLEKNQMRRGGAESAEQNAEKTQ